MTNDEIQRRIELTRMFVNDAANTIAPIVNAYRYRLTDESLPLHQSVSTLTDLNRANERLMIMLDVIINGVK